MKKLNTQTPYTIFNDNIEDEALTQFENCLNMEGCLQGALMADAHAGYTSPIGGVFKFKDRISPQIVGYDIGCGMCAIKLDIQASTLDREAIFTEIYNTIPVGFSQHKEPQQTPNADGTSGIVQDHLNGKGKYQMGTLGGGKDYCFQPQR